LSRRILTKWVWTGGAFWGLSIVCWGTRLSLDPALARGLSTHDEKVKAEPIQHDYVESPVAIERSMRFNGGR